MSFIARSRRGNACGTRRAVAEFESALIPLRNRDFRLLRMEGNEGHFAFESSARACAPRLRLGVRMGKFQLPLSHGERSHYALFRRCLIRGNERLSCRARSDGRGEGYQIFSAARAAFRALRCRECRLYFGKSIRGRRGSDFLRNAVSLRHAECENIFRRRGACNFDFARVGALSIVDRVRFRQKKTEKNRRKRRGTPRGVSSVPFGTFRYRELFLSASRRSGSVLFSCLHF